MSLFGAMTSGVSGLAAQSSAMAAISDNITNVNTVGYKGTKVDFQTLVTKQSSTFYAAGGVQSVPRSGVDVQGLLQSSAAPTNLAISGNGFFVVNESAEAGANGQFLFSRAGAFSPDQQGFLRNTGGYYLQGWPTDAQGNVVLPHDSTAAVPNQNIISDAFLETVNLNRVGGAAAATSQIALGANLPANDPIGSSHNIDVQFFDTLGNGNAVTFGFNKTATNAWGLSVEPPIGTAMVTLYDDAGDVYTSVGQLEFVAVPEINESVIVGGTTYRFVAGAPAAGNEVQVDGGRTLGDIVRDLATQINTAAPGALASTSNGSSAVLVLTGETANVAVDPNGVVDANGNAAVRQSSAFSVLAPTTFPAGPAIEFDSQGFPAGFNVTEMAVVGFESGAASMDDGGAVDRIALALGSIGQGDGLTQYGADFSPRFIEQNGSPFGNFSGVSIGNDGIVSALFDNGERRAIYKLPLVTFVNANALQAASGNAWTATESSGTPTLRQADSGAAGQIIQGALEASTVDIGEEFTSMIIVQRAYSAATRIISTADDMLEELVRIKR